MYNIDDTPEHNSVLKRNEHINTYCSTLSDCLSVHIVSSYLLSREQLRRRYVMQATPKHPARAALLSIERQARHSAAPPSMKLPTPH
jgi:hypothetical protein